MSPFIVPNQGDATHEGQAAPDKVDIDILVAGQVRTGVVSGCAVTQRAAGANMSVDVASGTIVVAGTEVAVSSTNLGIANGDATNSRKDLVVVNNSGTISRVAGSPTTVPVKPAIPANSVVLAEVFVPANRTTSIVTGDITDKRVIVGRIGTQSLDDDAVTYAKMQNVSAASRLVGRGSASGSGDPQEIALGSGLSMSGTTLSASGSGPTIVRKTAAESVTSSTITQDDDHLTFSVAANEIWVVKMVLFVQGGAGDFRARLTVPTGASGYKSLIGPEVATTNVTNTNMTTAWDGLTSEAVVGTDNSVANPTIILEGLVVNGANAGSVTLRWAQGTSSATATTIYEHSYLIAHKVS